MPDWALNIIWGVVSSLIAGIIVVVTAGIFSKAARWLLTGLLGRLLDIDTEMVFLNPREAAVDIQRSIMRSKRIDLLTGRGSELQRETFAPLFATLSRSNNIQLRVLLPDINPGLHIDWVGRREDEVKSFDAAYGKGLLRSQIETTIKFMHGFIENENVQARAFGFMLLGRVLILDHCAYLTPYSALSHSRESRVIKYRRGGDMYDFLVRLFNEMWDTSRPLFSDR